MVGVAKRRLLDLLTEEPTSEASGSSGWDPSSSVEEHELELISPAALLFFFFFFFLLLQSSSSWAAGRGMAFLEMPEA